MRGNFKFERETMHEGTVVGLGLLMILCVEAVSYFCSSPKEEVNQAFMLY